MEKFVFPLVASLLCTTILADPGQISFVASINENSSYVRKERTTRDVNSQQPHICRMYITSHVSNRFATTLVESEVKNSANEAKEATFTVVLPEQAYISEFVMQVGNRKYKAYAKEKEEARRIYSQAVERGESAGHVAVTARDSTKFTVSMNIEPKSKIVFLLTYEELLQRKNNQYELILNIHPGQIVKDLNVMVQINETRPLKFVRTPSLRSGIEISKNNNDLDPSSVINIEHSRAVVKFNPDSEKQKQLTRNLGNTESCGLRGQFVVQYDVEREPYGGEVLLLDGYFVHFFAPNDLDPLPKHVIFVLDSSGSMGGKKIEQLKKALHSILDDLTEQDKLSIIDFGTDVHVWDASRGSKMKVNFERGYNYQDPFNKLSAQDLPTPTRATYDALERIRVEINYLSASGLTNVIGALATALYLAKLETDSVCEFEPIIVFLTDGYANTGLRSTERIIELVTRLNTRNSNIPIFSLSFGESADKKFLRKLSLKNRAFSKHIYVASDASLQLQEFYKEISSPLLSGVTFKYSPDATEVTKTKFPLYFEGSEIIVAGRCGVITPDFVKPVEGSDSRGAKKFQPAIYQPVTSLERLWAYLTIKQMLEESKCSTYMKEDLERKALNLALKYSFVTEVSSLVVVKPNETKTVNTEAAYETDDSDPIRDESEISNRGVYQLSAPPPPLYINIGGYGLSAQSPPLYSIIGGYGGSAQSPPLYSRPKFLLPWLSEALNPNGTLTVGQNVYNLGNSTFPPAQTRGERCSHISGVADTGVCSPLFQCPFVHSYLTNFSVYQQYFCSITYRSILYAGVCCPPPPVLPVS